MAVLVEYRHILPVGLLPVVSWFKFFLFFLVKVSFTSMHKACWLKLMQHPKIMELYKVVKT